MQSNQEDKLDLNAPSPIKTTHKRKSRSRRKARARTKAQNRRSRPKSRFTSEKLLDPETQEYSKERDRRIIEKLKRRRRNDCCRTEASDTEVHYRKVRREKQANDSVAFDYLSRSRLREKCIGNRALLRMVPIIKEAPDRKSSSDTEALKRSDDEEIMCFSSDEDLEFDITGIRPQPVCAGPCGRPLSPNSIAPFFHQDSDDEGPSVKPEFMEVMRHLTNCRQFCDEREAEGESGLPDIDAKVNAVLKFLRSNNNKLRELERMDQDDAEVLKQKAELVRKRTFLSEMYLQLRRTSVTHKKVKYESLAHRNKKLRDMSEALKFLDFVANFARILPISQEN